MSIFDKLKNSLRESAEAAASQTANTQETFTFEALPESVDEMKALPEAALDTPFKAAALTVCALCAYAAEPDIGIAMLDFLRGPRPLSNLDKQLLKDQLRDKPYLPFSYFAGAIPDNNYMPNEPLVLKVSSNTYSYANEKDGYVVLQVTSGGADSPRSLTLRRKGDGIWCLWEYAGLLPGIRAPKARDPWA